MARIMDANFGCTRCGKCCHDLRLPLDVDETFAWLDRGGRVEVLCEALPWPENDDSKSAALAADQLARSFAAQSGTLPTRIVVTLAARFAGACPELADTMQCGIYAHRPLVCRIYPAEVSPFVDFAPQRKACPPEAWNLEQPALLRGGRIVDPTMTDLIQQFRARRSADQGAKQHLCGLLGIDTAGWCNEGFAVYTPHPARLRDLLELARESSRLDDARPNMAWRIVSNRRATARLFESVGAVATMSQVSAGPTFEYLGLFDPEP